MMKTTRKRLLKSEFLHEVIETVKAWDYYLTVGNKKLADEMLHKWYVERSALEHITDNLYGISRNGETYSVVNERDYNDRLFIGYSVNPERKKEEMIMKAKLKETKKLAPQIASAGNNKVCLIGYYQGNPLLPEYQVKRK